MSRDLDLDGAAADRALLRPFRIGLLGVAIVFVLLGGLLSAFGSTANRPEGVAERWLAAVGDTRRDGVKDRARADAEEVGPLWLADDLLPAGSTDGRAAFTDLEVGRASRGDDVARVPFRVHQRVDGASGPAIEGTIVLQRDADDHWKITALEPPVDGIDVPSEGGAPAVEAPGSLFVGAIGISLVLALLCTVAVRAAGPPATPGREQPAVRTH